MIIESSHAASSELAIAMFVLSVTFCEIITYELPNILNSNPWPLKWRLMMLTIWMKIVRRAYFFSIHMFAEIGAPRSSRLFAVHNRIFRNWRTYGRTDAHTFCQHTRRAVETVQRRAITSLNQTSDLSSRPAGQNIIIVHASPYYGLYRFLQTSDRWCLKIRKLSVLFKGVRSFVTDQTSKKHRH